MQAIEFKSQLEHGQITVPTAFHLMDETASGEDSNRCLPENVWQRTAGAWQGGELIRDLQGEDEQRLELE